MNKSVIEISRYIHLNLKEQIKKKGYDLVSFPPTYLNCTYQAFNWRLKNGQFHTKDILICLSLLGITFDDLTRPFAPKSVSKLPKLPNKPTIGSFSKLNEFLNK